MRRLALVAVLLAGGSGGGELKRLPVDSRLLGRTLEQGVWDTEGNGDGGDHSYADVLGGC